MSTQWQVLAVSGLGGGQMIWLGLDYVRAEAGLRLAGIAVSPATWMEVRLIEMGATEELNRE